MTIPKWFWNIITYRRSICCDTNWYINSNKHDHQGSALTIMIPLNILVALIVESSVTIYKKTVRKNMISVMGLYTTLIGEKHGRRYSRILYGRHGTSIIIVRWCTQLISLNHPKPVIYLSCFIILFEHIKQHEDWVSQTIMLNHISQTTMLSYISQAIILNYIRWIQKATWGLRFTNNHVKIIISSAVFPNREIFHFRTYFP